MHPRGKDLYDAMLLAEATTLPLPLLQAVFEIADSKLPPPEDLISFGSAFEWVGFEQQNESTVDVPHPEEDLVGVSCRREFPVRRPSVTERRCRRARYPRLRSATRCAVPQDIGSRPSRSRVEAFSLRRQSKPKADDRRSRTYGSRAIP